jgi:hypothetical protein
MKTGIVIVPLARSNQPCRNVEQNRGTSPDQRAKKWNHEQPELPEATRNNNWLQNMEGSRLG